ncbi:MAG TPA: metalloregulator ArsR/SmtB family transcription factor [Pyrinomonadaceae bacterium]|nr:metalloregulator ArsR/SmtB family transcription factor [Pyrinomonadaceae bacterium]
MINDDDDFLCSLFLSLSDPTRLKLLRLLATEERSVGNLAANLGESQPKVSRHLAFLRDHDVVTTRREGKHVYYRICEKPGTTGLVLSAIFDRRRFQDSLNEQARPVEHIRPVICIEDPDLPVYLL